MAVGNTSGAKTVTLTNQPEHRPQLREYCRQCELRHRQQHLRNKYRRRGQVHGRRDVLSHHGQRHYRNPDVYRQRLDQPADGGLVRDRQYAGHPLHQFTEFWVGNGWRQQLSEIGYGDKSPERVPEFFEHRRECRLCDLRQFLRDEHRGRGQLRRQREVHAHHDRRRYRYIDIHRHGRQQPADGESVRDG